MKERTAQAERTAKFKESVGLSVTDPVTPPPKVKLWSELIEENKEIERKRREKANEAEMKKWRKQVEIRRKVEEIEKGDSNEALRRRKTTRRKTRRKTSIK